MKRILWILKHGIYYTSAIAFLSFTPHELSILYFIKDIFFCSGWSLMMNFLFNEFEYRIEIWRTQRMLQTLLK